MYICVKPHVYVYSLYISCIYSSHSGQNVYTHSRHTFQPVTGWCLLQNTHADKIGEQVERHAASNINPQTRYTGGSFISWQQCKLVACCLHLTSVWPQVALCCRAAISVVQAYKDLISPLLPSVCRFLPSCSTYSVQAFEQFGAGKGIVLMAWRIVRCNPFRGGYQGQYDPPQWPPVGLEAVFRQ